MSGPQTAPVQAFSLRFRPTQPSRTSVSEDFEGETLGMALTRVSRNQ